MATKNRKKRESIRKRKDIFVKNNIRKKIDKLMIQRGEFSEERVERILEKIKEGREIDGFLRTRHGSSLDRQGIDFVIFLFGGRRIFIQVKSSPTGALKHIETGLERGKIIPFVVINPLLSDEEIKEKILKIIRTREEGECQ